MLIRTETEKLKHSKFAIVAPIFGKDSKLE